MMKKKKENFCFLFVPFECHASMNRSMLFPFFFSCWTLLLVLVSRTQILLDIHRETIFFSLFLLIHFRRIFLFWRNFAWKFPSENGKRTPLRTHTVKTTAFRWVFGKPLCRRNFMTRGLNVLLNIFCVWRVQLPFSSRFLWKLTIAYFNIVLIAI